MSTINGDITVTGTSAATGSGNYGIYGDYTYPSNIFQTTGIGSIYMTGDISGVYLGYLRLSTTGTGGINVMGIGGAGTEQPFRRLYRSLYNHVHGERHHYDKTARGATRVTTLTDCK